MLVIILECCSLFIIQCINGIFLFNLVPFFPFKRNRMKRKGGVCSAEMSLGPKVRRRLETEKQRILQQKVDPFLHLVRAESADSRSFSGATTSTSSTLPIRKHLYPLKRNAGDRSSSTNDSFTNDSRPTHPVSNTDTRESMPPLEPDGMFFSFFLFYWKIQSTIKRMTCVNG
jgi:hypothetical protein